MDNGKPLPVIIDTDVSVSMTTTSIIHECSSQFLADISTGDMICAYSHACMMESVFAFGKPNLKTVRNVSLKCD